MLWVEEPRSASCDLASPDAVSAAAGGVETFLFRFIRLNSQHAEPEECPHASGQRCWQAWRVDHWWWCFAVWSFEQSVQRRGWSSRHCVQPCHRHQRRCTSCDCRYGNFTTPVHLGACSDRCTRKGLILCFHGSTVLSYMMFALDRTSFKAPLAPRICKW